MDPITVGLDIGFLLFGVAALIAVAIKSSSNSVSPRLVKAGVIVGCITVVGGTAQLMSDLGRLPVSSAAELTIRIMRYLFFIAFAYFFWVLRKRTSHPDALAGSK